MVVGVVVVVGVAPREKAANNNDNYNEDLSSAENEKYNTYSKTGYLMGHINNMVGGYRKMT